MARSIDRLLFLLAASGLSAQELRRVLADLREVPAPIIVDYVLHIRKTVSYEDLFAERQRYERPRNRSKIESSVTPRVEKLLRKEAGLTVRQAAIELLRSISNENPGAVRSLGPPNKESFKNWLEKLLRRIGPSELLHHATLVRDQYEPPAGHDWPLRK